MRASLQPVSTIPIPPAPQLNSGVWPAAQLMSDILRSDSAFRSLPRDLTRRQILFFDAVRLSAEMAAVSLQRLLGALGEISKQTGCDLEDRQISTLTDAWSIVDSIHRFRVVVAATPRVK